MLARKVIVFGVSSDSAMRLAQCVEEVYFYNVNNREFIRCNAHQVGPNKLLIDLISVIENMTVNKEYRYDIIDDTNGEMKTLKALVAGDVPGSVKRVTEEIRRTRYELKRISVNLRVSISDYYLMIDQSTEARVVNNGPCSSLMDSRKSYQHLLNTLYQEFHSWWDTLMKRMNDHAL